MAMKTITVPPNALVMMVGPAGSGKSTLAARHFRASEIVSSDKCREYVSDDMTDMGCSGDAFDLFHFWIEKRLKRGRLTVADSTALNVDARKHLSNLATEHNAPVVVLAMLTSLEGCQAQNAGRSRFVPPEVIEKHYATLERILPILPDEGYHAVHYVHPREELRIEVGVGSDPIPTGYIGVQTYG